MVPQADTARCQDEVALVGAAAVARAAPAHPVVAELVPFRVGGCLLVTAPGRLVVRVGGLTLPFVARLALGLPLALGLVLALLRWCVVHGCPGRWAAPGKGLDLLIDLPCPEQRVLPDRQHGRLEGVALMHLLVNLPPCVALGNCQDVVLWRGKSAPDVLTIEPLVPALQVLPGDVELAELREREDAHEEGVAEHRVHPLELVASFGLAPLFHLILPVPAINRALLSGLPWPFSWLRECAYQVFHGDETDLASCAELELALHQLVASLKGQLGFGELGLLLPNPLQLSPFARDREIRGVACAPTPMDR